MKRFQAMNSSSEGSSEGSSTWKGNHQEHSPTPKIAIEENKAVAKLRLLVLCALFVSGVALSLGVFAYARQDEHDAFETNFEAHALKVLDSFNEQMRRRLGVMDSFSKMVTSYALEHSLSFPNVTLPNFEVKGLSIRQQVGALRIDWMPLITSANRSAWESYAMDKQDWLLPAAFRERTFRLDQDVRFQLNDEGGLPGLNVYPASENVVSAEGPLGTHTDVFSPSIYKRLPNGQGFGADDTEGPYLVLWQFSPVTPTRGSLNYNVRNSVIGSTFEAVLEGKRAVLGNAIALTDPQDPAAQHHAPNYAKSLSIGQYRHSLNELVGDPTSMLVYPVFDSFDEDRILVGVVRAALFWRFYFVNILPLHVEGVMCVIENTWNQTFTYRIDGPKVTFLGPGDRHDPKYDKHVVEDSVTERLRTVQGPVNTAFRQVELGTEFCRYTLRLYPSKAMEVGILTKQPVMLALLVLVAFLIPSFTFLIYNYFVENRQTVVMDQAVATGNIVSSLFPQSVATRLMDDNKVNGDSALFRDGNSLVRKLARAGGAEGQVFQASAPIADSFAACTIMFGDIAGFTAWSSDRSPDQVFLLLESIYCAFDEIAEHRKVFKVETIGDCYVAVAGVPTRVNNHAVIMAKFAWDCLQCLPTVVSDLEEELGEGTKQLQLRVGLHTGPVTAGVLRGQKSRFSLFGDSMNTTARVESNGIPGRIHISQATADALIAKGKGEWVVPRDGMIEAKGKGKMQTYWLRTTASCDS